MSFEFLRNKDVFKFSFYIVIFEGARIKKIIQILNYIARKPP